VIRHEERVDVGAVTAVVRAAHALALEAEAFVEADGRLVPGKDVQLELADPGAVGPPDCGGEQSPSDPLPTVVRGDHQPEVRDVGARGMCVARERQTSDDSVALVVDGNEDGRIGMTKDSLEVTALVGGCSPSLGREVLFAGIAAVRGR